MPITSSGEIKLIADIEAEFDQTGTTDISLLQAGSDAGLSGQIAMTAFYSQSDSTFPTISTSSASSVGTSSFTANGNITSDGGASITARGFYVGTSGNYSLNTKYTQGGTSTGSFSLSIGSLSSNTTYYITAWATNSVGESRGSTVSQATSFGYTFKYNIIYDSANYSKGPYYSNVNGGYTAGTMQVRSAQCSGNHYYAQHSTNRQNYYYSGSNNGSHDIYFGKAANWIGGCGRSTQTIAYSFGSMTNGAYYTSTNASDYMVNTMSSNGPSQMYYTAS